MPPGLWSISNSRSEWCGPNCCMALRLHVNGACWGGGWHTFTQVGEQLAVCTLAEPTAAAFRLGLQCLRSSQQQYRAGFKCVLCCLSCVTHGTCVCSGCTARLLRWCSTHDTAVYTDLDSRPDSTR
jgi:hypothetical protein